MTQTRRDMDTDTGSSGWANAQGHQELEEAAGPSRSLQRQCGPATAGVTPMAPELEEDKDLCHSRCGSPTWYAVGGASLTEIIWEAQRGSVINAGTGSQGKRAPHGDCRGPWGRPE